VPAGRLNEAVKRNIEHFPEDFMFQLTLAAAELSRSQSAILNSGRGLQPTRSAAGACRIQRLPKAQQRFVMQMIDTVLAQQGR
jgi:hypothetical protein